MKQLPIDRQEKFKGNYMASLYKLPNQILVKTEKSWKLEFIMGLIIGILLLIANLILHKHGLL